MAALFSDVRLTPESGLDFACGQRLLWARSRELANSATSRCTHREDKRAFGGVSIDRNCVPMDGVGAGSEGL